MTETPGYASISTGDGFTVESNTADHASMHANFNGGEAPKDQTDEDKALAEKAEASKAASTLGKKGAEALKAKKAQEPPESTIEEEDAPEAEAKTEEASEAKKDARKGNPRHDAQARIRELAQERREARERADAAERRLAEIERERRENVSRETSPSKPEPKATAKDEGPKAEDFASYDEYVDARAEWKAERKFKELTETRERETAQNAYAERMRAELSKTHETFNAKIDEAEAREELADFLDDERFMPAIFHSDAGNTHLITPDSIIGEYVWRSDEPVKVVRYLRDHEDEYQRIATLRDPAAIRLGLARIEAKVTQPAPAVTAGNSVKPAVSKAHPPVKPVTGAPSAGDDDDTNQDFDSYAVKRIGKPRTLAGARRL